MAAGVSIAQRLALLSDRKRIELITGYSEGLFERGDEGEVRRGAVEHL